MKLFVDDIRVPSDNTWTVARTYDEAISVLKDGDVEVLSLDHDLGEGKSGYDVICWVEDKVFTDTDFIPPKEILVHSANPVGRNRIYAAIDSIQRNRS